MEAALVEFCAPTLMGLKPAGLFRYRGEPPARAGCEVLQLGRELAPFGLALRIMSICPKTGASLICLYRAA